MVPILSSKQTRELDAYTIQHEPVKSIDLMERASLAFTAWFMEKFDVTKTVGIVCGTGNNGGDGLAIARILREWKYNVRVWIVRGSASETEDFKVNLARLKGRTEIFEVTSTSAKGLFSGYDILIDAIFGSGLSRPAEGVYAQAIQCFNQPDAVRVAVDIPSGVLADEPSTGEIVRADFTISFQLPKLSFLFPSSAEFTGKWITVDIGLSNAFLADVDTQHFYIHDGDARVRLKSRTTFNHKGSFGHALLIAGSYGKMGAAVLSSRAALRSGLGLLTTHIPQCGYAVMQTAVPEAMVQVDDHERMFTSVSAEKYSVVGIGPGIGQSPETVNALRELFTGFNKPMVIDADALNILGANREILDLVPHGSVLTPHPKEFERVVGEWKNDFERLEKQKELAERLHSVVILKGAYSSIAAPDRKIYFNSTGNPGMATGGTGDVLTGILTGLLAQGYSSLDTAILGVFLHGLSGDLAATDKGYESLIASDLIEYLPGTFQRIRHSGTKF